MRNAFRALTVGAFCALAVAGCSGIDDPGVNALTTEAVVVTATESGAAPSSTKPPAAAQPTQAATNTVSQSGTGAREDPVSLGREKKVGGWKVKVAGAVLDATDIVLQHNEFNEAPAPGQQYVVVEVEALRTAEEAVAFWAGVIAAFVEAGGSVHEVGWAEIPDSMADTAEVAPGESVSGNLVFVVPSAEVGGGILRLSDAYQSESGEVFFAVE